MRGIRTARKIKKTVTVFLRWRLNDSQSVLRATVSETGLFVIPRPEDWSRNTTAPYTGTAQENKRPYTAAQSYSLHQNY